MTLHVTLAEAQGRLPELIAKVAEGEEVLIDADGLTVARLGPAPGRPDDAPGRHLGVWAHLGLDIGAETLLESDDELDALMSSPLSPPS